MNGLDWTLKVGADASAFMKELSDVFDKTRTKIEGETITLKNITIDDKNALQQVLNMFKKLDSQFKLGLNIDSSALTNLQEQIKSCRESINNLDKTKIKPLISTDSIKQYGKFSRDELQKIQDEARKVYDLLHTSTKAKYTTASGGVQRVEFAKMYLENKKYFDKYKQNINEIQTITQSENWLKTLNPSQLKEVYTKLLEIQQLKKNIQNYKLTNDKLMFDLNTDLNVQSLVPKVEEQMGRLSSSLEKKISDLTNKDFFTPLTEQLSNLLSQLAKPMEIDKENNIEQTSNKIIGLEKQLEELIHKRDELIDKIKNSGRNNLNIDLWQKQLKDVNNEITSINAKKNQFKLLDFDSGKSKSSIEELNQALKNEKNELDSVETKFKRLYSVLDGLHETDIVNKIESINAKIKEMIGLKQTRTPEFGQLKNDMGMLYSYATSNNIDLSSLTENAASRAKLFADNVKYSQNELEILKQQINEHNTNIDKLREEIKLKQQSVSIQNATASPNVVTNNTHNGVSISPVFDVDAFVNEINTKLSNKHANINVKPNINADEFIGSINNVLNQAVSHINVSQTLDRNTTLISNTTDALNNVINKVNEKTNAFEHEKQVVESVIASENSSINSLVLNLSTIIEQLSYISSSITSLPKIDFKLDLSQLKKGIIDKTSVSSIHQLNQELTSLITKLNDINLQDRLNVLYYSLNNLSAIKGLGNLSLDKINCKNLINAAKNAEKINELSSSLSVLFDSVKKFNGLVFDFEQFNGLKISSSNVKNMYTMAEAISTVKDSLSKFTKKSKETLGEFKVIVEQSSALQELNKVLKTLTLSYKNIGKNNTSSFKNSESEGLKNSVAVYDSLIKKATLYYSLLEKERSGTVLSTKEAISLSTLSLEFAKATDGIDIYSTHTKEAKDAQQRFKEECQRVQTVLNEQYIAQVSKRLDIFNSDPDKASSYREQISKIREILQQLHTLLPIQSVTTPEQLSSINMYKEQIDNMMNSLKGSASDSDKLKLFNSIQKWMNNNTTAAKKFQLELDSILKRIQNADKTQLKGLANEFLTVKKHALEAGLTGLTVLDKIRSKLKSLVVYLMSYVSFYRAIAIFKNGIGYIKELNSALTEFSIVTKQTGVQIDNFGNKAYKIADSVASTTTAITKSATDWSRLGYSAEQSLNLAGVSAKYAIVGFSDVDSATTSLTSTLQAFYNGTNDVTGAATEALDIFTEIGNNYPITTAEIGEGIEKCGAALQVAGNDIAQTVALLTSANSTLQDVSTAAASLKVVSMRLRGTSASELEKAGEDTEGVIENASKLYGTIRNLTKTKLNPNGISILTDSGAYKSTFEIMKDIQAVWNDMNDASQASLLEVIAGKTRATAVASILSDTTGMLEKAYATAQNSDGSADSAMDIALESIENKMNVLQNSWQHLWQNFIDSDVVKLFVESLTKIVDIIDVISSKMGSIPIVIGIIGTKLASLKGLD